MERLFKELPEIFGPFETGIRVPEYTSVPATSRILAMIDSREMQRLRMIRQLGFVDAVFPGAVHSRFEHSLGVFYRACMALKHLCESENLLDFAEPNDIRKLYVGCLVHDLGHYPAAHIIEELGKIPEFRTNLSQFNHLETGYRLLTHKHSEVGAAIEKNFGFDRREIADYIYRKNHGGGIGGELYSLLDGPIDVDKMDYLERDSIHTGVPYGRNYDAQRLVANFTLLRQNNRVKILLKEKGKAGAEVFIFSRYVMFTEVYWHHTARCFSAMYRRAFLDLAALGLSVEAIIGHDIYHPKKYRYFNDQESFRSVMAMAESGGRKTAIAKQLLEAIVSGREGLYKRLLILKPSPAGSGNVYEAKVLAQKIVKRFTAGLESWRGLSRDVAAGIAKKAGIATLREHHLLIDTPLLGDKGTTYPVYFPHENVIRDITEISPVAGALDRSFNESAQQVRLYIAPQFKGMVTPDQAREALAECLDA